MSTFAIPKLYAIADRATLDARGVSVAAFACELRSGGVRLVQYRDKQGSPREVLRAAAEIAEVFAGPDAMLVMNDRADLAVLAGWRGVHVGHRDMPVEAVRRVLAGPEFPQGLKPPASTSADGTAEAVPFPNIAPFQGVFVGVSTHNDEQVRAADSSAADYVAIGPVFDTASKADTEPVIGLDGVRRARELTTKPLVAIGGITRANARSVIEAGADSVAVIGGLFAEGESVSDVARDFLRILG